MKTKPMAFNILTISFLLIAISIPLQIAFLYEHGPGDYQLIFNKITYLNWSVISICLVNAFYAFDGNRYLKISIPLSIFVIAFNNWFVGNLALDYSATSTLAATISFALFTSSFIFTRAWDAVMNPGIRWWKVAPRQNRSLPVWINLGTGKQLLAKTFDLSQTGAFISTLTQNIPANIGPGGKITISIDTNWGEFKCRAEVVRAENTSKGHYPSGLGIRFLHLDFLNQLRLIWFLKLAPLKVI